MAERGPGRPKRGYRLADGTRVPGTTTITGRFKDSGGLIHWAWQCGIDGEDYRRKRDAAADVGTLGHDMIEASIYGETYNPPPHTEAEKLDKATTALEAFERWARSVDMVIGVTELPMVSEEHRFGGTLDAVGHVDGDLVLIDWKTSKAVYHDYLAQLGAYSILWRETRGEQFAGAHLLRIGKAHGEFAHHSWPRAVLDLGEETFLTQRRLYDLDKKLKEAC